MVLSYLRMRVDAQELIKNIEDHQTALTKPLWVETLRVGAAIPDTGDADDWELAVQVGIEARLGPVTLALPTTVRLGSSSMATACHSTLRGCRRLCRRREQ
jgi:hypothetical protein